MSVSLTHRGVALLALISLFIGLRNEWTAATLDRPYVAAVLMIAYGVLLILAVAALTVPTPRWMTVVDLGLLAVGVARAAAVYASHLHRDGRYGTDEGSLLIAAARALRHGDQIYGTAWPDIFAEFHAGNTKLMDGGIADTYGYPPLGAVLTMLAEPLSGRLPAPALVAGLALLATAVLMFLLLPPAWRSGATLVLFGTGWFGVYAFYGYPTVMALPFLVVAVASWAGTGSGGRLGWRGVVAALCLGVAAATQQLAWFIAPFLILGILLTRWGELGPGRAVRVTLRYLGLTLAAWAVINAPFAIWSPAAWFTGIMEPIGQHAVPHGQGLMGISYYFRHGSGALNFYGYAAMALLAAMLLALLLYCRWLGPAVVILPSIVFYLSTRSQDGYYILLTPLWLTSLITVAWGAFDRAWQPLPALLGAARRRWLIAAALLVPTAACLAVAIFTPPPLRMTIVSSATAPGHDNRLNRIVVDITNRAGHSVTPFFALSVNQSMTTYWRVVDGPATLAPHQRARFTIESRTGGTTYNRGGPTLLRAVSDDPMTITSVRVHT